MGDTPECSETIVHLSGYTDLDQETGELLHNGEIVAQLGPSCRIVLNCLVQRHDHPVSLFHVATDYATAMQEPGASDLTIDDLKYREGQRINSTVRRIRTTLNLAEEGLGKKLETVRFYGYRWRSQDAADLLGLR